MRSLPLSSSTTHLHLWGLLTLFLITTFAAACGSDDVGEGTNSEQQEENQASTYTVGGTVSGFDDVELSAVPVVISLNGDETLNVDPQEPTFEFETELEDGQSYEVTIVDTLEVVTCNIENGSGVIDGQDVTDVHLDCTYTDHPPQPANFTVEFLPGESTVDVIAGQEVVVVAQIENDGGESGTQDIVLAVDSEVVDTTTVEDLEAGATVEVTLTWQTDENHEGTYAALIASDDDSDAFDITVDAPPEDAFFTVSIDDATSTLAVDEGEVITVDVTVENIGQDTGTQDVTLTVDDVERDAATVELDGGDSQSLTLYWTTADGDAGTFDAVVASEDEDATVTVEVSQPLAPAFFAVSINETASTVSVEAGQTITVVVDVENTGELAATQDVTFSVGGDLIETDADLSLDGGEDTTLTFQWETTGGDVGNHTLEVATDDASDTIDATVAPEPNQAYFTVTIDEAASTLAVDEGGTITIVANIENVGDIADTQDITLEINSFQEDIDADITLDGGDSTTVTLQWQTAVGDAGTFDAVVASDDGSDSTTVAVIDPDADATLTGHVFDDQGDMEGVEVLLFTPGEDTPLATTVAGAGGAFEFDGLDPDDYELGLRAPGLEPSYEIEEAGGDNRLLLTLQPGANAQDLTVDWLSTTDVIIDGGMLDLQYGDPNGQLAVPIPECEEQPNGSWEPAEIDTGSDNIEIVFDPPGECFRINAIEIDLLTGALDIDLANAVFPNATIIIDDSDGELAEELDSIEIDFDWLLDGLGGFVDFTIGEFDIDMDFRILVGGAVVVDTGFFPLSIPFGSRTGEDDDCQLTGGWGGDITNPTPDTNDEQIGDYLHDPIAMMLTTATSGTATGIVYDAATRLAVTVDNQAFIDRLSEGPLGDGRDDPGGASCGDISGLGEEEDFAAVFNDLLDLPAASGSVYSEFNLLVP